MGFLDFINPFKDTIEQAGNTIDKLVLDKDLAATLKAEIRALELQGDRMALELQRTEVELKNALLMAKEETHKLALQTKTLPWVDALHKMSRTLLSFYSMTINAAVVVTFAILQIELSTDVLAILGIGGAVAGTYVYKKGAGAEAK